MLNRNWFESLILFLQKVSLGPELYIAPEVMYVHLGLPQVIKEVTEGLPDDIMQDCLSHILLTGGNTDLSGFGLRLTKDLRDILPQHSDILEVKSCPGTHSWNVAMGSTYVPLAVHPGLLFFIYHKNWILNV